MITVIGSLKGGTGKSTVTFNLALWLAYCQRQVVTFDLDPQGTLHDVCAVRREEKYQPAVEVLSIKSDLVAKLTRWRRDVDEVLVDVGTANFSALKSAVAVADRVIIPVQPSQADIWSTQRFLKIVSESAAQIGRTSPPELFAFINRADTHHAVRESDEAAAVLTALPGLDLLNTRLGQRTVFRRSLSEGVAVFELDPASKGAQEFNALAAVLYPARTKQQNEHSAARLQPS